MKGIGVDIVEISRIKRMVDRWGNRFAQKVFTPREIELCEKKPNFVHSLAARWAAKEAFAKAIGTGWDAAFRWKEIEILSDLKGKPIVYLAKSMKAATAGSPVLVSLSHSNEYAIAIVMIDDN